MTRPPEKRGGGQREAGARPLAQKLVSGQNRTPAQRAWLLRQLNDPYVAAAKAQGFRSRAAFKLIELDDRFRLIRKGARVIDLGAAPGGWTQVAVQRGAGIVVGIDLLAIDPVPGAVFVQGDFADAAMPEQLTGLLGGRADLVLSDMAPNTTGHAATDHVRIVALAELAFEFARQNLAPGGGFLAKMFQGGAERDDAGGAETGFWHRAPRQTARQPQGEQRTVRGCHGFPRRLEGAVKADRRSAMAPPQDHGFTAPDTVPPPAHTLGDRVEEALAFDDVLLVPAYSEVLPGNTDTRRGSPAAFRCTFP